jgi:penicillin G amidase
MSFMLNLLGSVAREGLTWLGRQRLPQIDGRLDVSGLGAPVEVIRDRWGVPHIFASGLHDLFFAQGFIQAQDRLFQMELNRRTACGRLSELFGALALDTDRAARTFGFARLGRADWGCVEPDLRDVILAYTEGVNAYLNLPARKLPVEFTLFGSQPSAWQPEDTAALARLMIWQLSHAWHGEIVRAQIIQAVGAEHAAELEIHYPAQNPVTLPFGIEYNRLGPEGGLQHVGGPFLKRGMGSNTWAVSGQRTGNGHAYLCNDMHMPLGQPSLWYGVHLVAGEYNVTGVSLPGVPLVLVGHNARIAWGMTLAFTDCEDLFVEQVDPTNTNRYRFGTEWRVAQVVPEMIHVKGRPQPHVEEIVITHHGPVISDVVGYPEQRVAVNSMALRPCPAFHGWLKLNQAANWDEFVEAMRLIEAPQLNVSYADVQGNIGYWVTGKVPIRAQGDGTLPVPGWAGEYEWVGEVPFEEMPHAFNPSDGYFVSCNHRIVPDDYPYLLGKVWMNGYRARRLVDIIESKGSLTPADFKAMHVDFTNLPGKEFVACLEGLQSDDPDIQKALHILCTWDGILAPESVGGALYEVARYHIVRGLIEPALGEVLTLHWMGQGFNPVLLASNEFYGHDTVVLLRLLNDPDSWWISQAGGREKVLSSGLKQAVSWLRTQLGDDPKSWQWGKIHGAIFPHPLGLQKPLDQVFNRGPFPIGGDTDTPCQTATQPNTPYNNNSWAPSFRQIVDMGDLSNSLTIFPPGESGQLGSPHYADLIELWLKGEYLPMLWTRQQIENNVEGRLVLTPSATA